MSEVIPLFPLSTVLLPYGRIGLQIFEPRYLDLVSNCLKHDAGFGVVWLREGAEAHQEGGDHQLVQIGCYARIMDWDSLPNGLLGITIEGQEKFRVLSSFQEKNHLHKAEIEWIDQEPLMGVTEQFEEMDVLMQQLSQHPHFERLNVDSEIDDLSRLSFLLTQYLPIEEKQKFLLLSLDDPIERLQQLMVWLDEMSL
jgi:Lon protease-like protein